MRARVVKPFLPRRARVRGRRLPSARARLPYPSRVPYPRHLIQEGETVALDLRPHWWYFSRNIFTGIPLAIVLIVVLGSGEDWVKKYGGIVVGLVAVAWAVWLGLKYLQWRMTYFVVTSRRVIYRSGVISK